VAAHGPVGGRIGGRVAEDAARQATLKAMTVKADRHGARGMARLLRMFSSSPHALNRRSDFRAVVHPHYGGGSLRLGAALKAREPFHNVTKGTSISRRAFAIESQDC
jgi:hypothetical protein